MVKKCNIYFFFKNIVLISCGIMIASCSTIGSSHETSQFYKIYRRNIDLPPLYPRSILGLNTYIVQYLNHTYFIVISANTHRCSWLIDTIKLKKGALADSETPLEIPTNLYLNQDITVIAYTKKIANFDFDNNQALLVNSAKIELPYFIAVNNTANDNINYLIEDKIIVDLDSLQPTKVIKNIKLKFDEKYFTTLEILLGFQHTETSFNDMQSVVRQYCNNFSQ